MVEPDRNFAASNMSWAAGDFPAAAENMRRLAGEIAEMSLTSLDQAKRLIEEVRDARDMDELMAIQAKYMTTLFESFAERSRRISTFLAEVPREMTQAGQDMVEAGVEAAKEAAEIAAGLAAAVSPEGLRGAS